MAANRGEWAELYVLFKLLADGKIYSADDNLNRNVNSYLEIIKIMREEVRDVISEYVTGTSVEIYVSGEHVASVPATEFMENANRLHQTIRAATGRTFDVEEETKNFMRRAHITKIKAGNVNNNGRFGGKNDIVMEIRDHTNGLVSESGFSIKAREKSAATLFNAAPASAFVYRLSNISDDDMRAINSLFVPNGGKDKSARMEYIKRNGICMTFVNNKITRQNTHSVFKDNLDILRGDMQEILNRIILTHYLNTTENSRMTDICKKLIEENPMGMRNAEIFYTKAIKDFLYAAFAGMTAGSPWNGCEVVNGGYIVAKDDGDVLAFHTRDGESFKNFLFNSTKIDRPDASEHKGYPYADVYKVDGEYYFDLNFQVRFIS